MTDFTLSTSITILQHLTSAAVYLLCVGAAYLTLKEPRVRKWLRDAGILVNVVVLLALVALLYQSISPAIASLFAFPRGLLSPAPTSGFTASAQCLSGVAVLVGLALAGWRLATESQVVNDDE